MYLDQILIVVITIFATLAAAECGLTLKRAIAPFKLLFGGVGRFFNQNKKKEEVINDDEKQQTKKPEGL